VGIYAYISSSTCKLLPAPIRNMFSSRGVRISFAQPKVNEKYARFLFSSTNQEVLRLDIPVQVALTVNILDSGELLVRDAYQIYTS
jgi:hypothetical protein